MYVNRLIEKELELLKREYPVITITGPRQTGKTTLVKYFFKYLPYFSLEAQDIRMQIMTDPRGFLSKFHNGLILDEIQHLPELLSYIQEFVDEGIIKQVILTGSASLNMLSSVTQSLAGRTAVVKLYPFSFVEVDDYVSKGHTDDLIFNGFYPTVVLNQRRTTRFFNDYLATYLERDIRQIINIKHFREFQIFLSLLAGFTAKNYNASTLADNTGMSVHTINNWVSSLEALYIVFFLYTYRKNIRRRFKKSPKLFFTDTGLVARLLQINNSQQISFFPLRGELFENMVISEIMKHISHSAIDAQLFYYQDTSIEVDLIIETGSKIYAIEVKSAQTFNQRFLQNFLKFRSLVSDRQVECYVVYDGKTLPTIKGVNIINYKDLQATLYAEIEGES